MTYSGASAARTARENLGRALAALQEDPNIPPDVLAVAQNIAQAVGALFDAEKASSEPDGKASVKAALGIVGQTLALLQDVRAQHRGIQIATESIASTMGVLYPLTSAPSMRPPPGAMNAPIMGMPSPAQQLGIATAVAPSFAQPAAPSYAQPAAPSYAQPAPSPQAAFAATAIAPGGYVPAAQPMGPPAAAAPAFAPAQPAAAQPSASAYRGDLGKPREDVEVNIGANTESNFFVGFSGEIAEGGVFASTYSTLGKGTPVRVLVTLPGGFETRVNGYVRFVRDPMDMANDSEPGMGIQFDGLDATARDLILRFVKKRRPIFYDD